MRYWPLLVFLLLLIACEAEPVFIFKGDDVNGTNMSWWHEYEGYSTLKDDKDQDVWVKGHVNMNGSVSGIQTEINMGYGSIATGSAAVSIGYLCEANSGLSTAIGTLCKTSAVLQTCLGYGTINSATPVTLVASGNYATDRESVLTLGYGQSNPAFIDVKSGNITLHSRIAAADIINLNTDTVYVKGDIVHEEEVKGTKVLLCGAGRNSATVGTGYLRDYNGRVQSNVRGCTMTGQGSLTEIGANGLISTATPNATVFFFVRKNGANMFNCSIHADGGTGNKNCTSTQARGAYTFAEHDIISLYVAENLEVGGAIDIDYPNAMVWGYHDE